MPETRFPHHFPCPFGFLLISYEAENVDDLFPADGNSEDGISHHMKYLKVNSNKNVPANGASRASSLAGGIHSIVGTEVTLSAEHASGGAPPEALESDLDGGRRVQNDQHEIRDREIAKNARKRKASIVENPIHAFSRQRRATTNISKKEEVIAVQPGKKVRGGLRSAMKQRRAGSG